MGHERKQEREYFDRSSSRHHPYQRRDIEVLVRLNNWTTEQRDWVVQRLISLHLTKDKSRVQPPVPTNRSIK